MVSNQELKERLYEKRTGSDIKEYLECNTCKGSYGLQPGEKPEDYSSECECGGKLTYSRDISSPKKKTNYSLMIILVIAFLFIFIIVAIFAIIMYRSMMV